MWKRGLRSLWILLVCTIFCQSLLTSILALGWIYRWVRQVAVRHLFHLSPLAQTRSWREFADSDPDLISMQDPPALFGAQKGMPRSDNRFLRLLQGRFQSLGMNWRMGFAGILTTWSLTLLPSVIWSLAWYAGWQISFTKLYEESQTGQALGTLGILIFSLVMLVVPLAQTRHAVTQDWRSFFDLMLIRALFFSRPVRLLLLTIAYVICSVILIYFKTMPAFFPAMNPDLDAITPTAALNHLKDYYFYTGSIGFLLVVILRSWAARIYTGGLVSLWTQARLDQEDFHLRERELMQRVQIPYGSCQKTPSLPLRILRMPAMIGYRGAIGLTTILAWAIFGFLPFVSQFLHYVPGVGFLNQPLVQLPCFQYIPPDLENHVATLD